MGARAFQGIRPVDAVVTVVLCSLAAVIAVMDVEMRGADARIGPTSWLQLPVLVAAALVVLWWRRGLVTVLLACSTLLLLHVLAFGWVVRCGAGLPLAFVLAFLCGCSYPQRRRRQVAALALSVVVAALVLVKDSAAGPGILPVVVALQAGLYGIGLLVTQRVQMAHELRRRNEELQALRDERAALEVTDDRARLSARLGSLLDQRLSLLAAAAEGGTAAEPGAVQALLARLEEDSRRTLGDMREIVGQLRGGEVALAPAPSVAHLDALLARHVAGGSRLRVSGDPRVLPASVELSAYRIVEHLVSVLDDGPSAPVAVTMTFSDDALGILVAGSVSRAADLRSAVTRARQRALLHAGSLDLKTSRGRAQVLARLPVLGGT